MKPNHNKSSGINYLRGLHFYLYETPQQGDLNQLMETSDDEDDLFTESEILENQETRNLSRQDSSLD